MSQYPYGYPSQGQPAPPQYSPYNTYSNPNGYATQPTQQYPPQLQPQPSSTPANSYYAASQLAYNHNASSIPGLGTPSTAPAAFAVPFGESWSQGYGLNTPHAQHTPYSLPASTSPAVSTSSNHRGQTFDLPSTAPKAENRWGLREAKGKESPKATANVQPRQELNPTGSEEEEGEVSEPDFDDLYDDISDQVAAASQAAAVPAKTTEVLVANNSDQEPDFYDTKVNGNRTSKLNASSAAEFVPQQVTEPPHEAERGRSRSYSPYLSPREVEQDSLASSKDTISQARVANKTPKNGTVDRLEEASLPFGANGTTKTQATASTQGKESPTALNESAVAANGSRVYANVPEAQNEAKKAILRLLPHVKYQAYIDEGFDATLVKELFSQLHLPTDPAAAVAPEKPAVNQEKESSKPSTEEALPTSPTDSMVKKKEERKDKIARLMAEKKAKSAVSADNKQSTAEPQSVNNTTSQLSTTPPKPLKTRAEMDRLLQQKMQALRQKAAQKPSTLSTPKSTVGDKPTTPTVAATLNDARLESAAGTPVPVDLGTVVVQEITAQPLREPSGVGSPAPSPLPSAPKNVQAVNQRKRPVAADFMDYPPASIKRPSLANRQNSSLVISLSDDEDEDDDDDDIEMEVDSPEESPAPVPQSFTLPKRGGPSIRDYPPLTNRSSPRHLASPTPGASAVGGNVDLQARERQIMDLKRRIQEAEARAKNKPKMGSATPQTPSAGNRTPTEQFVKPSTRRLLSSDTDDKGGPSAQLLQEAEAATNRQASEHPHAQLAETERRSRVSSVQLPGKSDKLREKAERLRKMQEEMMKLQAEIDEDLAEEEERGDEVDTSNHDMSIAASPSMTHMQPAETIEGPDAPKLIDDTPGIHDAVQQSADALLAIDADIEAPDDQEENMDISSTSEPDERPTLLSPIPAPESVSLSPQPTGQEETELGAEDQQIEAQDLDSLPDEAGATDANASDDYEPPGVQPDDRMADGSPPFSPAPADHASSNASAQHPTNADVQKRLVELRNQLISRKESKEQMAVSQPDSVEETSREAQNNASTTPTTSFVPYDSPLRYFRAYRFHPGYSDDVASGLKSLTYSSTIDPKKEMCPDELDGTECPRGNACQFQHFRSIVAPDNEIILDLGSSDDLTGDQKKSFNNGLRELVATFQQSRVRDFETIAQAIVEFRRRFLGDSTKVLRLEGVNI